MIYIHHLIRYLLFQSTGEECIYCKRKCGGSLLKAIPDNQASNFPAAGLYRNVIKRVSQF